MAIDFTTNQKMKYVNINLSEDIETAILHFAIDNEERYLKQWIEKNRNFKDNIMFRYGKILINNWLKKIIIAEWKKIFL